MPLGLHLYYCLCLEFSTPSQPLGLNWNITHTQPPWSPSTQETPFPLWLSLQCAVTDLFPCCGLSLFQASHVHGYTFLLRALGPREMGALMRTL